VVVDDAAEGHCSPGVCDCRAELAAARAGAPRAEVHCRMNLPDPGTRV
jgi:hypothetical protein